MMGNSGKSVGLKPYGEGGLRGATIFGGRVEFARAPVIITED